MLYSSVSYRALKNLAVVEWPADLVADEAFSDNVKLTESEEKHLEAPYVS